MRQRIGVSRLNYLAFPQLGLITRWWWWCHQEETVDATMKERIKIMMMMMAVVSSRLKGYPQVNHHDEGVMAEERKNRGGNGNHGRMLFYHSGMVMA